jgi:hypothetical protein
VDELGDHGKWNDALEFARDAPLQELDALGRAALIGVNEDVRIDRDPGARNLADAL